jgi:signal peptidase II
MKHFYPLLLPALVIVSVDQLAKWWARAILANLTQPLVIVSDWLQLTSVEHGRVAFTIISDRGLILLIFVILAVIITRSWAALPMLPLAIKLSAGLILGGDISNLIDRGYLGYVLDFITSPRLPILQIFCSADVAITIGGILLATAPWQTWHDSQANSTGGNQQSAAK